MKRIHVVLAILLSFVPFLALYAGAQVAAPPDPGEDPVGFFKVLFDLIVNKHWWAVAGVSLIGVVWLIKKGPLSKWVFWTTKWGGWLLNVVVSFGGALATAWLAGQDITPKLFLVSFQVSGLAAGLWELLKDVDLIKKVRGFLGYDV